MKTLEAMYDDKPTTELQSLTGIKQARVHQDQRCATNVTFHSFVLFGLGCLRVHIGLLHQMLPQHRH